MEYVIVARSEAQRGDDEMELVTSACHVNHKMDVLTTGGSAMGLTWS